MKETKIAEAFTRLVRIMDELREKCPWDRKQTTQTLRTLTIEETYELADAITRDDWKGIKEEIGDILLHIIFYARIGTEQNQFTLDEAINEECEKLIANNMGNTVRCATSPGPSSTCTCESVFIRLFQLGPKYTTAKGKITTP